MNTSLLKSAKQTLEKIADAPCSVDESPDLHYVVKIADKIYNCDEDATGMIANSATTVVAESLALKSRSNHNGLAVEGQEQAGDEWGEFAVCHWGYHSGTHDCNGFPVDIRFPWF